MNDKIKVLHVIDHLGLGGIQDLLLNLARRTNRRRFEIEIAMIHRKKSFYESEFAGIDIPVHTLSLSIFSPMAILRLIRLLRKGRYDILHTHLLSGYLHGILASLFTGKIMRVSSVEHMREQMPEPTFPLYRLFSSRVDAFFALNKSIEKDALGAGIAPSKVKLQYFGCDVKRFQKTFNRESLRQNLHIGKSDRVLLSVARIAPDKKHHLFVQAMPRILKEVPDAKLVIAGDGSAKAAIERLVRRLGLDESVLLLGQRQDIPDLNAIADLGVTLGFGIACMEHMVTGLPVVSFDQVGAKELIKDGVNGFVAGAEDIEQIAEYVILLFKDDAKRRLMGENARKMVEATYTYDIMTKNYEDFYESLLKGPAR